MKWIGILAAAFVLASPVSAQDAGDTTIEVRAAAYPTPYFMDLGLSHLIECTMPNGDRLRGTGNSTSATDIVTAYHVVAQGSCAIGGVPVTVVYADPARDFAVVRGGPVLDRRIPISCAGYREGDDYFAVGWAFGSDLAVQRFTGTSDVLKNPKRPWSMLRGKAFHGQSGGAVYDRDGRMVGIVNAGPEGVPWVLSLPLSETYLCKGAGAS